MRKLEKKVHILLAPPKNLRRISSKFSATNTTDLYYWQFCMLKNNKIWTRFQGKIMRKRWKFSPTSGMKVWKLGEKNQILLAPLKKLRRISSKFSATNATDLYFWQFCMLKNNNVLTRFQWKIKRKIWKFRRRAA